MSDPFVQTSVTASPSQRLAIRHLRHEEPDFQVGRAQLQGPSKVVLATKTGEATVKTRASVRRKVFSRRKGKRESLLITKARLTPKSQTALLSCYNKGSEPASYSEMHPQRAGNIASAQM